MQNDADGSIKYTVKEKTPIPPLSVERFPGLGQSEEVIRLAARRHELEDGLYERMSCLISYRVDETAQDQVARNIPTDYRVKGQQRGRQYTRAWLERDIDSEESTVKLIVGKAEKYGGGSTRLIEGSRVEHIAVGPGDEIETQDNSYVLSTDEQKIEFLEAVHDTLRLIEASPSTAVYLHAAA